MDDDLLFAMDDGDRLRDGWDGFELGRVTKPSRSHGVGTCFDTETEFRSRRANKRLFWFKFTRTRCDTVTLMTSASCEWEHNDESSEEYVSARVAVAIR